MVSGFFTSPQDHERIRSGEASAILIESKSSGWVCWLNRFRRSFIACLRIWSEFLGGGWDWLDSGPGARKSKSGMALDLPGPGFRVLRSRLLSLFQLHVDRQRTDLLDQHVERFG